MKRYGYHRTSTREQHLDRGIKEITAYCEQNGMELEKIFTDQQTGKNFNRPRYQVLKEDVLRTGDELIITEVDRLGRNKQETLKELQYYRDNGIRVKILELPTTLMDLSKLDNAMVRMLMETINNMLIKHAGLPQLCKRAYSRSFIRSTWSWYWRNWILCCFVWVRHSWPFRCWNHIWFSCCWKHSGWWNGCRCFCFGGTCGSACCWWSWSDSSPEK